MEEARALAGAPRSVTLQVEAPPSCSDGAGWELCFGISTGGRFFEEFCFEDDDCGTQYWRSSLALGHHTLRFEGQIDVAGWSWKLHDGKVYKPRPAHAETWHATPPPDETKGVLVHYAFYDDSPNLSDMADVMEIEFVLAAAGGFDLTGGLALIGPAATVLDRALTSSAGAFCSDLGRVHADDPYFWASACSEAVGPNGDEFFLPIADAQCNATICSKRDAGYGLVNTTNPCKDGDLLAACAVRCCSVCTGSCVVTPLLGYVPQWSFGKVIAVAILLLLGCYCGKYAEFECIDCSGGSVSGPTVLTFVMVYACLWMMDIVLEDETSPFWGEEDISVMAYVRILILCICACATVCGAASLSSTVSTLPFGGLPCAEEDSTGSPPPPIVPRQPQQSRVKTLQQVMVLPFEQLHAELAATEAAYRKARKNMREEESRVLAEIAVAIKDRLATEEGMQAVQEGIPPMRMKGKPTFAESAYRQAYENAPRAVDTTMGMLFNDVQVLIDSYCRRHHCASDQIAVLAQDLTARLMAQNQGACSDGIANAAMFLWTSNLRLEGGGQDLQRSTLFMILNETIRQSRHPQANVQPAIVAAARIARCINELCVLPRLPPGQYYPADNVRRVFRGGGFDPQHRAFYDLSAACDSESGAGAFRIPQYWATSLREDVATRFMRTNSGSGGLQSVLWTISMAADQKMWNAALVESTHFVGEHEYLFVPFSTFLVQRVNWVCLPL
eukprot:COSAG02_NODE_613_length_19522_cov_13.355249_2_plen_729_part_00